MNNRQQTTKVRIVGRGAAVLRKATEVVPIADIKKPKIQKILKDMAKALHSQEDGVAIAAPQIGKSLRIFIVNGWALNPEIIPPLPDVVFINPEIKKVSRKKLPMEEGCLSVRGYQGHVARHEKATVSAYDENGKRFTMGGSGLVAQIFQHEMDHLDGILFIDKTEDLYEIPKPKGNA